MRWRVAVLGVVGGLLGPPLPAVAEPLIVGIDRAFPPYQYVDSEGRPAGFDLDLFRAVAEIQGIEYRVRAGTWSEIRRLLEAGEIDVSPGVVRSEVRDELLDFSVPTAYLHHGAFVHEDSGIEEVADLVGTAITVERSSIWEDRIRERGHDVTLDPVEIPAETLLRVRDGKAHAAVLVYHQGLFLIRSLELEGMRSIGTATEQMDYRFAVPEGREELLERLNDGLVAIRLSGRYDQIYDRWLGVLHRDPVWARPAVRALAGSTILVSLLLIASALWSRSLQRRVEQRTRQLLDAEADKRALQAQLLHSQKMEALGRLASGVAHDLNNVLTVILGALALARDALRDDETLQKSLQSAHAAARSAGDLSRQLLAFSRRQEVQPRRLSWNRIVEEQSEMLRRLLGSTVRLEVECEPGLGEVVIDPGQASQILLNLAVNARDAIGGKGTIRIATGEVEVAGQVFLRLSVSDDGVGIDPEIRDRIFDPFFTTKGEEGTGLGLSTVYGIATQHGGTVRVESDPGRGSVFHVDLPPAGDDGEPVAR